MNFKKIKSAILSGMIAASSVAGTFAAAAPSLNASAANDDYARLLQYSLYFFDANMCGDDVQSKGAMSWRGNCHTDDAVPGGYHDAGDHAMFGLPQGFAASTLGWSYYEFPEAYTSTGQADHLKLITDRFCDFFKRSAKKNGDTISEFLYQKGDGDADHGYWGPPEHQGSGRRMFWTGSTGGDIAAEYAAALAVNYINFGNKEDLEYAKAYYNYAKSHNSVATDGPTGFYNNGGAGDEIAWAAGWLYKATNDNSYKNEVGNYNHYLGWVHGWESVDLGAACLEAEINNSWGSTGSYIAGKASGGGYLCLDDWGSCRLNTSLQFTALVATKHGAASLGDWCKGQMDYILGNNPFNTCFVTGFASNSAKNVHHRAASGYEGYNPPDGMNEYTTTYHPSKSHVLIGALTGGPNKAGQYSDVMNDYQCNEVAIDYNACLVGAAAGLCYFYDKGGKTDSNITGVTKIYSGGSNPTPTVTDPPQTQPTTPPQSQQTTPPTTTTPSQPSQPSTGDGYYEIKPGTVFDYAATGENDRMIGWEWADFGLTSSDKPTKVEVDISASGNIGKWQGAFGSSTTQSPDYWTMTDEMQQQCSGNKATITWEIDSATQKIIQTQYHGEVKFGTWWVDCQKFTVDAVRVYVDGGTTTPVKTTEKTTAKTTERTTAKTTEKTTQKTTVATQPSQPSTGNGYFEIKPNKVFDYAATDENDRMVGWEWADFGLTSKDVPTKVEVDISASGNIGKWQGAFGSSTTQSPDYWTMTDEMQQQCSGSKATITWNIDSATQKLIQTQYHGEVKFGTWWVDCQKFTIDAVRVYTDGSSTAAPTTAKTTAKTTEKTTTKATNPPTTQPAQPTVSVTMYGDANCDGKVTIADATAILMHLGNEDKYGLSVQGAANADVDGKKGVTPNDAITIQSIDAGLLKQSDLPLK